MMPRHLRARLIEALDDAPAVALLGPRQVGKTTLAHEMGDSRLSIDLDLESSSDRAKLFSPPGGQRWAIEIKRSSAPKIESGIYHARQFNRSRRRSASCRPADPHKWPAINIEPALGRRMLNAPNRKRPTCAPRRRQCASGMTLSQPSAEVPPRRAALRLASLAAASPLSGDGSG
jgi:hypothetical protein